MNYIEENRGFITASKLKYFITYGPEAYKFKYIDEIPVEGEEKKCFKIGTAFDDLVSYGKDFFSEKYRIDDGYLVQDYRDMLTAKGIEYDKKAKKPELELLYYGKEHLEKIRLTPGEGEMIMGMYAESLRQPIADMGSEYKVQEAIEVEYKGLKLRGKLDRFDPERFIIRDWKSTGRIEAFERDIEGNFDYILSMAFYFILVKVMYGIDCDVVLDVVGKQKPYPYIGYRLSKQSLLQKIEQVIVPALEALIECIETDTRTSYYPIDYERYGKYGEPIISKKGEPISRMKLMKCDHYSLMVGSIANNFISPN